MSSMVELPVLIVVLILLVLFEITGHLLNWWFRCWGDDMEGAIIIPILVYIIRGVTIVSLLVSMLS